MSQPWFPGGSYEWTQAIKVLMQVRASKAEKGGTASHLNIGIVETGTRAGLPTSLSVKSLLCLLAKVLTASFDLELQCADCHQGCIMQPSSSPVAEIEQIVPDAGKSRLFDVLQHLQEQYNCEPCSKYSSGSPPEPEHYELSVLGMVTWLPQRASSMKTLPGHGERRCTLHWLTNISNLHLLPSELVGHVQAECTLWNSVEQANHSIWSLTACYTALLHHIC